MTIVSSPGAQESLWPRITIQARIRGAAAARISSQRRIGKVSKPVHWYSSLPQMNPSPWSRSGLWSSEYQLRKKRATTRMTPASTPTISERESFERSIPAPSL